MAFNLYILACNIGSFRLGSTVSGLREEMHHYTPWQCNTKVPKASTTTTHDVLSPMALLFMLLFGINVSILQHTANKPNGILCYSQYQCHSDNVPSSGVQDDIIQLPPPISLYAVAPVSNNVGVSVLQNISQDTLHSSSVTADKANGISTASVDQSGTTQMSNIHVFAPHLLDATYSPPPTTVSTTSAQRQISAVAGLTPSSVVHYGAPMSTVKHLEDYYFHAADYCFTIPVINGILSSSLVSNAPIHRFLFKYYVPHLSSNYAGIHQLVPTTTSYVHSLSAADV